MQVPERYLITSALPYANGPLHVGHIAGAYLPAVIYVRYLRKQKRDVLFICGSDEHGAAITIQAKKEKQMPVRWMNEEGSTVKLFGPNGYVQVFVDLFKTKWRLMTGAYRIKEHFKGKEAAV